MEVTYLWPPWLSGSYQLRRHPGLAAGGFGAPCSRSLEGCLGLSYYTPNVNMCAYVHVPYT
jgi:hypothetical protein